MDDRTEPYEVCIKGQDKTIGYACAKCHRFCSPLIYACKWEDALKAALDHAKRCCANLICSECDKDMGPPKGTRWLVCQECRAKKDNERESKLYKEAEKIPFAKYEHDFLYYADEFYEDIDAIQSSFSFDEPPEYAWACYPVDFAMDATDIVSSALESGDHHEEAFEEVSDAMLKRLQKYLDLWCKKASVRTWMPDFKKAVLLPKPEERCHVCGKTIKDVSLINDGDDGMGPTVCTDCYTA
jgi:hypothetical protein